jgi:hypothetical protein
MPSKKRSKESEVREENRKEEREEEYILEEDDQEEEVEYSLDENAEEKLDEALMILSQGAPAIISSETQPDHPEYPTETHLVNKVKYAPGDKTLPFNTTLILR